MARITAASSSSIETPDLEDYEPYAVTLETVEKDLGGVEKIVGDKKFTTQPQLILTWTLETGETIRDYAAIRLGKSTDTGKVSKLRQLLNALSKKAEGTEIAWFDDEEPYAWSYDGDTAFNALTPGQPVIVRGKTIVKDDPQWGETKRYRVQTYQAVKKAAAPKPIESPKPAPATVDDEDDNGVPF